VVFSGVNALDWVGPAEAFLAANAPGGAPEYEVVTLGEPCLAAGATMLPGHGFTSRVQLDTLIVPGGSGLREPETTKTVAALVTRLAPRLRRIVSVCTGIYGLAPTGLLDGRRATTHWQFTRDVAGKFPRLKIEPDALFIKDGKFYTSAGVTAGIDLALALIEEDLGPQAALAVARELVVFVKRPGGQAQYSEPLRFQTGADQRFKELIAWIAGHLPADLSIDALARRVGLCPRHFCRVFKDATGHTPAGFVEEFRLAEASRRLADSADLVEQIGHSVGYRSGDGFRRAFERRFRVNPHVYRQRFSNAGAQPFAPSPVARRVAVSLRKKSDL